MWRIHYLLLVGVLASLLGSGGALLFGTRIPLTSQFVAAEIASGVIAAIGWGLVFVALVAYGVYVGTRAARRD